MTSRPKDPTPEAFARDVADHVLTIEHDDGLHRRLICKKPGTNAYRFDVITWPGSLCYTGDMGTYVFERLPDMFEFFRSEDGGINLGYWAEKVQAVDKTDGLVQFSPDVFRQIVRDYFLAFIRDRRSDCTREERRELWDEIQDRVLCADEGDHGVRMFDAANEFEHTLHPGLKFVFRDFWDHNFNEYTFRFLWACHAIVWAIQQYDAAEAQQVAA